MINVGIVGVGNVAAMLVQSVEYYRSLGSSEGLIHEKIGKYEVAHIRFVYAVDVSREKVGRDLSEAIFAFPNSVRKFAPVARGVTVRMGKVLDGVAPHMVEDFRPARAEEPTLSQLAREMQDAGVEVLLNLLPVGSEEASRFYAAAAAQAGAALVNAIPVFIASKGFPSPAPVLGDDIKGQLGATAVHRALASLVRWRGARLLETYQLNVGGNTDFKNMLAWERLASKKESKTMAVASTQERPEEVVREERVYAGPSGYVPFLGNTKVSHIYLKALAFAGSEVEVEVRLKVDDKAMASAVLVDAIRVAKVAMDHGLRGSLDWASAFYFKHPPRQARSEMEALRMLYAGLERLGERAEPRLDEPF